MADHTKWRKVGTTVDGLPVLLNPAIDQQCVRDPVSGTFYGPMEYETIRVRRIKDAGEDLLEALEAMGLAVEELLTEFVSKKRAADWGIINEAGIKAGRAIAKARPAVKP